MSDQSADDEVVLRRYLLADLDEQQREQIEERLLSDDDFADELSAAESSLVDDYVFDQLPSADREKFEQNFILDDDRRNNLLLSQAFEAYLEPKTGRIEESTQVKSEPSWWKKFMRSLQAHKTVVAFSAAAVVLLIVITPLVIKWFGPVDQRARIERQIAEYNRRPFTTQSLALPSLELTVQPTALLRGGSELTHVAIAENVKLINLRLALPNVSYGRYAAVMRTVEGVELFSIEDLAQDEDKTSRGILVRILSEHLPTNDYQLDLKGIAADGTRQDVALYNLRVSNASRL